MLNSALPVSENRPSPPAASASFLAERILWAVLIAATLFFCYFSHLGLLGFVGPDEPRYAWIARNMAETGDWVTPMLYGQPWFEKPVLYYWGAAASFKLFGVSEAAARLPSALAALLATLALGWLGWRIYGAETARWLLLLLSTTLAMIGFSHAAATDMPFSAMLTVAMACAAVVLPLGGLEGTFDGTGGTSRKEGVRRTPWLALILFGVFLGAAVLAKGPAALILCGGAVLSWALLTRRWKDALRLFHPAALTAFFATALPWYWLCAHRNPAFFRIFIIEHNFKRYLTPEFRHVQPFWYYGPILLLAFLPWTGAFCWAAIAGIRTAWKKRSLSAASLFFLCWAVFCVLFFSVSRSKLPGYILPAIPPAALLLARSLSGLARRRRSLVTVQMAFAALLLIPVVVPATKLHVGYRAAAFWPLAVWVAKALLISNAALGLYFLAAHSRWLRFCTATLTVLPVLFVMASSGAVAGPLHLDELSASPVARALQALRIPPGALHLYEVSRGSRYALNFYLRRELPDWTGNGETQGYIVSEHASCAEAAPGLACKDLWGWRGAPGSWHLLRVEAAGLSSGR